MKINGNRSEPLRPAKPTTAVQGTPADAPKSQPTGGASGNAGARSDSVQISDTGRALATGGPSGSSSLSADRVAELRKKVLEGAYNSTHVVDQVAKRILERGDA
jgi:anti-sigma28 factor (negative regulator of flagellin synthesis)